MSRNLPPFKWFQLQRAWKQTINPNTTYRTLHFHHLSGKAHLILPGKSELLNPWNKLSSRDKWQRECRNNRENVFSNRIQKGHEISHSSGLLSEVLGTVKPSQPDPCLYQGWDDWNAAEIVGIPIPQCKAPTCTFILAVPEWKDQHGKWVTYLRRVFPFIWNTHITLYVLLTRMVKNSTAESQLLTAWNELRQPRAISSLHVHYQVHHLSYDLGFNSLFISEFEYR